MKINNRLITTILLGVTLASCTTSMKTKDSERLHNRENNKEQIATTQHHNKHWSYDGETGPEHWSQIVEDSECDGKFQSPINIVEEEAIIDDQLSPLDIHYAPTTHINHVKNNGHSIQYDFEEGDYINYKGDRYDLKQIHFHESSEHTINGIRYPLVIHMVHVNAKAEYLVLAVMAKEGKTSSPFDFLENYFPLSKGETKTIDKAFDLNLNLPNDKGYYNYTGSLTTPPCTQGVNWFVFKEPITVSLEQVKVLRQLMPIDNFRNEQALNGRKLRMTK